MNKNYTKSLKSLNREIKSERILMKFVYNDKLRKFLFSKYNKDEYITMLINKFARYIL
jgi:hypothetical protein